MIIPMQKYTFLVFHKEYGAFLKDLQQLGALHIIEKEIDMNEGIIKKQQLLNKYDQIIKFLEKRETGEIPVVNHSDGGMIIGEITRKQDELTNLQQELSIKKKEHLRIEPFGNFSPEIVKKLENENYHLRFFKVSQEKFKPSWLSDYNTEIVSERGNQIWFVIIQRGNQELNIAAEEIEQPKHPLYEIIRQIIEIEDRTVLINNELDSYANSAILLLKLEKETIATNLEYEKVFLHTINEADEKMNILEGWIPETSKKQIESFLEKNNILYVSEKASNKDKVPILLKNNKFSRLFEPIGKLFSLPSYSEMDLTVFFAPFFMMFFGFCLGDAGYGLLFVIGAGLYKLKARKEFRPVLSLIQILGMATVIFGIISGTFFGINLIETNVTFLENYQSMFLNSDNMFNLALVLGALQIVFGMIIRVINQIKQYGFISSLATCGWLIIIIGSGVYVALSKYEIISTNNIILYSVLLFGGFLIVFFSDIESTILVRIGKGVWDIYSTVTGMFGDLLSYIRLFALGLSSAILGYVINDIAMQILGSSPIIGPIFFVIFLLLGHGLNILISSLGSFVHPMRLTFVEFYKNAGFAGGGKEYKPFSIRQK